MVLVIGPCARAAPEKVRDILVGLGVRPRMVKAIIQAVPAAAVLGYATPAQVARPLVSARAGVQAIEPMGKDPANGLPGRRIGPATVAAAATEREALPAGSEDMEVAPARRSLALNAAPARGGVVRRTVGGRRRGSFKVRACVGGAAVNQQVKTPHRAADGPSRVGRPAIHVAPPAIRYSVLGLKSLLLELM